MLINDEVLASEHTYKILKKKKKTLLVTIFFTTKNIFIFDYLHHLCIFKYTYWWSPL
jgi:hypothetical protein